MPVPTLGELLPKIVARFDAPTRARQAGPVETSREGMPELTVTVTDELAAGETIAVEIVVGDDPGPASFHVSRDDGTTWDETVDVPEHSTYDLEPGLQLGFDSGFDAGDRYDFEVIAAGAKITSIIGEQGEGQNDAPPRLVWVPTHDGFGPPIRIGNSPNGRAVLTRIAGVECHIWAAPAPGNPADQIAANLAVAEQLVNDLLYALHEELRIGTMADGGTWRSHGVGHHEVRGIEWKTAGTLMQNGVGCALDIAIHFPVISASPAVVRPESFAITGSIHVPTND